MDIYDIDELGPTTGTVFQIFANNNLNIKINTLFDTGAMKSVMSLEMYKKLKLKDLDTTSIPHVVGASGESLGARGRTKCEVNINGRKFYQTFIVCEHLKRPIILGRDFSIQNCIGISWTKSNTHQLTQNNEVIAETTEYQTPSRASISLKKNIKVPPRSCTVVDIDINTTKKIKVDVIPNQLWLSANPNICTYPMIADLKEREPNTVTPFVIVNFSHHEHLHLPKDHVVAFAEKDCNEGEVLKICTMEQLEKELPRNWIPERKRQEKFSEFFENPFMQKDDDFLKSPVEAPVHRKVLLEDKNILPKTQEAFDKLCKKYEDIISKNSGDIGKTMLVEMEIDTGNHPPIASKPYTLPLKHYNWVQSEIETLERAGIIERSISPWASPIVIVPKKSVPGEPPRRRMYMDYQRINKLQTEVTKADGGKGCISLIPLPKIDELYAKLKDYKVFSSLDLRSGYYHIGLKESAKPKSAFVLSSLGKYQFNRVPFGLAQAPAYFQKLINDILKGCNFAMGYLDDIIIYSRSKKEHLEHLEEIFTRLKAAGLKLKLEVLFLQKTHTVSWTFNFGRQNPTPTRKTRKHRQNASTKKSKRSKTIPLTSRILQKIHSKICGYFTSANTPNQKRCRIQMDTGMRKLFSNLEGIPTASTNTPILRPPSQLHTLHRCIKIRLCRHIDTTQQWHGPPHHLCKWTIPWITTKLGNTHKGSLCNLHVSKETQFLHRHSQNNS